MATLSLENVKKSFGKTDVIHGVSVDIQDGEFIVIVGPSGCGKSTLLRMVAGLETVTSGDIRIDGARVNDKEPMDRDIAMVFQSYALYPHMTVYDNMAFGLKLRKTPKAEIDRRVKEAGDILGIENLLDRKPKQLSGGQRQRVALGRAIVRQPQAFLMDEPLSNLDAALRVKMRTELLKLQRELQATVLYVTHDQTEAMTMGSRICVLKDGLMMQIDSPQNLYDRPDNIFVAGFIGSPAMNFFDVTLVEQDGDLYADAGTFRLKLPPEKVQATRPDYVGKEVVFGVRPEDIHDREFTPPNIRAEPTTAEVDVTELMGNEIFVYLLTGKKQFIARVDPRTKARVGGKMDLAFNMENVHLFDRDTEQAIR